MNIVLQKTKFITTLIRERWAERENTFGLLEIGKKSSKPGQVSQQQFIQKLNEELEQNRVSHPSQLDDEEMNKEQQDEAQE